jgi:hypothetical protein
MPVKPQDVKSPREHWVLIDVLLETPNWSLAVGAWDGRRCLAARWNGDDDHPKGNPVSHGVPTWFVLPEEFFDPLLAANLIPPEKRGFVEAYLNIATRKRFDPVDLPSHDLGPWPEGLSLRREDIYGENGR